MLSKNEWDPLQKVIVGVADGATIPPLDLSLRTVNYAHVTDDNEIPQGPYPQQVIDEANEDLDLFCNFLIQQGVEVLRVDRSVAPAYYNYCPRDSVLVHDDLILATPQPLRSRHNEYMAMNQFFKMEKKQGARYIVKQAEKKDELYNTDCIRDKNTLALTNVEPCFDAANILRDNDNLYYLVSNSGNKLGAAYLQEIVGTGKKVWPIEGLYSFMHIDSTIALLREGLMLLNPTRVKSKEQLPKPLQSWDVIWAADPEDIGHYPGFCGSSAWLNINLFSINPNLVVMEQTQHNLRRQLEKYKIDCAMLPGRQQRTLGGGFHCVTLDIVRKSN